MSAKRGARTLRVAFAAGGTGGHFYPGLAVLEALAARAEVEPLFVGTPRGIEARVVPQLGHRLALFDVSALNGVRGVALARSLGKLPLAAVRCARAMRAFRPHAVVTVGGYASGPASAVAVLTGVPLAAVAPDVLPGIAIRAVGPFVARAYVAFEESARHFRAGRTRVFGVPVRRAFRERAERVGGVERAAAGEGARAASSGGAHVLVIGGSQGARALNRALPEAVAHARALGVDLSVTHQTGTADRESVAQEYAARGLADRVEVREFIDDVASAMARADLLVCRAGAATVAELCIMGRPAVFVPLPTAADDHQRKNAEAVAKRGAGVVLPQAELSGASLGAKLAALFADRAALARMGQHARALGRPDAADRIAEDLLALLAARG